MSLLPLRMSSQTIHRSPMSGWSTAVGGEAARIGISGDTVPVIVNRVESNHRVAARVPAAVVNSTQCSIVMAPTGSKTVGSSVWTVTVTSKKDPAGMVKAAALTSTWGCDFTTPVTVVGSAPGFWTRTVWTMSVPGVTRPKSHDDGAVSMNAEGWTVNWNTSGNST